MIDFYPFDACSWLVKKFWTMLNGALSQIELDGWISTILCGAICVGRRDFNPGLCTFAKCVDVGTVAGLLVMHEDGV